MYDERKYDSSLPETSTEELLACIHILYEIAHSGSVEPYKMVDRFLFSECAELENVVPIDVIRDGEGLIVLEYLRDVELNWRSKKSGGCL